MTWTNKISPNKNKNSQYKKELGKINKKLKTTE